MAILHLDRYPEEAGAAKKTLPIEPSQRFEMGGANWEIAAAVAHIGEGAHSGHYFAIVRTDANEYRVANDESVGESLSFVDAWAEIYSQPMLLFCVRVPGGDPPRRPYSGRPSLRQSRLTYPKSAPHRYLSGGKSTMSKSVPLRRKIFRLHRLRHNRSMIPSVWGLTPLSSRGAGAPSRPPGSPWFSSRSLRTWRAQCAARERRLLAPPAHSRMQLATPAPQSAPAAGLRFFSNSDAWQVPRSSEPDCVSE